MFTDVIKEIKADCVHLQQSMKSRREFEINKGLFYGLSSFVVKADN